MSLSEYFSKLDRIVTVSEQLPRRAAIVAVNFSKARFKSQNWVDSSTEPWKKRKQTRGTQRNKSRAILVNSGRLRRSIRVVQVSSNRAVIGSDVDYAEVHNEGFRGQVKQNVRKHERTRRGQRETVKAHSRTINQNIPQRRFIGESQVMEQQITRMMIAEINRAIK